MANEKEKTTDKKSAVTMFREKLSDPGKFKENILEGLKSTNSRVRALASKAAFKAGEYEFVKKNVLPLINTDKSKKVLRVISDRVTRKDLMKRVKSLTVKKAAAPKTEAQAEAPQEKKSE